MRRPPGGGGRNPLGGAIAGGLGLGGAGHRLPDVWLAAVTSDSAGVWSTLGWRRLEPDTGAIPRVENVDRAGMVVELSVSRGPRVAALLLLLPNDESGGGRVGIAEGPPGAAAARRDEIPAGGRMAYMLGKISGPLAGGVGPGLPIGVDVLETGGGGMEAKLVSKSPKSPKSSNESLPALLAAAGTTVLAAAEGAEKSPKSPKSPKSSLSLAFRLTAATAAAAVATETGATGAGIGEIPGNAEGVALRLAGLGDSGAVLGVIPPHVWGASAGAAGGGATWNTLGGDMAREGAADTDEKELKSRPLNALLVPVLNAASAALAVPVAVGLTDAGRAVGTMGVNDDGTGGDATR